MLSRFQRQLCDIQGRLFERAGMYELDSLDCINKFMNSETCAFFDLPYNRLQWAGEEYILATFMDEVEVKSSGFTYSRDELFWIGYVYRYWHFLTGENSKTIYSQAKAELMKGCYTGFHSLDVEMAIENLKEIHSQYEIVNNSNNLKVAENETDYDYGLPVENEET